MLYMESKIKNCRYSEIENLSIDEIQLTNGGNADETNHIIKLAVVDAGALIFGGPVIGGLVVIGVHLGHYINCPNN